MLNRNPNPVAYHAAFTAYCTKSDISMVQRLRWRCIGQNENTKHFIFRRDDKQVMILTEGGKRIGEAAALLEVSSILCGVLKNGCVESSMLPRNT